MIQTATPNRTFRRTFGNGNGENVPVDPAQIRKFLTDLCEQVEKTCQNEEYEGRVEWKIVDVSPTSFHAEIRFIEVLDGADNPLTAYKMVVSKRYYDHNIVRMTNLETQEVFVLQADPRVIVAWLNF